MLCWANLVQCSICFIFGEQTKPISNPSCSILSILSISSISIIRVMMPKPFRLSEWRLPIDPPPIIIDFIYLNIIFQLLQIAMANQYQNIQFRPL